MAITASSASSGIPSSDFMVVSSRNLRAAGVSSAGVVADISVDMTRLRFRLVVRWWTTRLRQDAPQVASHRTVFGARTKKNPAGGTQPGCWRTLKEKLTGEDA